MHCSEFRDRHCALIDDTLAGVELVRMQGHLAECPSCAELDVKVRRSLMAIHSLPSIEPSADFRRRLEERLCECRGEMGVSSVVHFRTVAMVGAVASMLMLGYVAASFRHAGVQEDIVLPPVIALARPPEPVVPMERQPRIVSSPMRAIAASVSAGMPLWPAAAFAEQAPLHFATYREAH
jgi:hypothetical protein